jgi:hypothetical protein
MAGFAELGDDPWQMYDTDAITPNMLSAAQAKDVI